MIATQDRILDMALLTERRWNAELELLSLICPRPRYRWPLAMSLGATAHDFTGDDSWLIGSVLHVASYEGQIPCMKLAARMLFDAGMWRDDEERPFICGTNWGPGPLVALFNSAAYINPNEIPLITAGIERVHALPTIQAVGSAAA